MHLLEKKSLTRTPAPPDESVPAMVNTDGIVAGLLLEMDMTVNVQVGKPSRSSMTKAQASLGTLDGRFQCRRISIQLLGTFWRQIRLHLERRDTEKDIRMVGEQCDEP